MKNKTISAFLASLFAISLLTGSASAMTFPDVDSNSPYSKAIEYVSELGIMVGDSNGNFNPNNIVSRCEMATIVCRVLDETENLSKTNAAAHPDIEIVSERVDDGYSGVLFDRPAFQEMMNDIVSGKINCVIVKDLSRLGREYIETGRYLRQIFPTYGVRFISINDGIDTANEQNGDDLHTNLKNLLNDTYCRDISVKTRSALLTKRQNGDYVGACPIYGYRKDPDNKNHLIIDEDAARVVRDIYRRRIDGASAKHIADELNRLGVLSPMAHKR